MLLDSVFAILLISTLTFSQQLNNEKQAYLPTDYDPMTSNYAPDEEDQSEEPYTISESRLKKIRQLFMYPYYNRGGNANNTGDYQTEIQNSAPQVQKDLDFLLPFFGFRYNYTRVSLNGYLEFSDPPESYTYPIVFPVKNWPEVNDPSFIGPFFSKCKRGILAASDTDRRQPGVYYRVEKTLGSRTDRMGVEIRERTKWDIREGNVGAENFEPEHVIIVTWKNVSFAGGITTSLYNTNTFQLVLATDEISTYAMFNYANIVWTSFTEAGGDVINGDGGVPAFVGFNAGNSTGSWEYIPYSQTSVIGDLTQTGFGNNQKGRHYFKIDELISQNSCKQGIDGANLELVFAPKTGNMLGGTTINITGPCFEPTDVITCKFGSNVEVTGMVIDTNRAICVQPALRAEGYIKLEVKIGSQSYKWKGNYYVETPATATQTIFFNNLAYYEKNASEIRITWEKHNLTMREDADIRISLWGYRESGISPEFVYINDLVSKTPNNGAFTIIPSIFENRDDAASNDIQFGFIQINLTEPTSTSALWSRPLPLAWYFGPQWERKYGASWAEILCDAWVENDQTLKNFTNELPECPCTLKQALANKGRYLPDLDCDMDSNPRCYLNSQAMHCVKTRSPAKGEQQCCYDKNAYLMLSQDQPWGSNPRRSNDLGNSSYTQATEVPTLSQWYNDIIPKFVCCLWQESTATGCETFRYQRRPTQDCVAYENPGTAGIFGDPHIITFDGVEYTFNGKGEFVLVRSQNKSLDIQGRFEQIPVNPFGEANATKLTSVVAKENISSIVEIRHRPSEARWRYHLDVLVDGQRIYFDRPSQKFQHFRGVTVYTPTYIFNQSDVIVMFDSGAGLEVVDSNGYLTARVYLPQTFLNQTRGLFGNWSHNATDDFVLPDDTKVDLPTSVTDMERVYVDFGLNWMINDSIDPLRGSSLFFRQYGKIASYYNDGLFKPEFRMTPEDLIPANRSDYRDKAFEICGPDFDCIYDYALTYSNNLAILSKNDKIAIETLNETNTRKIISCGVLKTPRFGRKSTFLFVPGTNVNFECSPGYILVGDARRECLPEGEWNEPELGDTACLPEAI